MEKKIMIAVDESAHSTKAIHYAVGMSAFMKDVNFTLFHVQPTISQYVLDEAAKDPKSRAKLNKILLKNSEAAQRLLKKHQQDMLSLGIKEENIDMATRPRILGVAKDILEFSIQGIYDAVVLGKRGLSGLQEIYVGSVTANVLDHSPTIPIWLVDAETASEKIMVAVDGSENSIKVVDHLAFIFEGNSDVKFLFFHVTPKLRDFCSIDFDDIDTAELEEIVKKGDTQCIDRFFSHALKMFGATGIPKSQIEVKAADGLFNAGKAILNEYRQGNYGTIAIGRRGLNRKFFAGSVSRYVMNRFANGALWVVP
jgi:nucleotide-binding universal stress UspA family protein